MTPSDQTRLNCRIRHQGDISVIHLDGRFVFHDHRDFRQVYEQALARSETLCIQLDMGKLEYLDSSALGMLLLLRERGQAQGKAVRILGARGLALQVLEVANFHKLFDMTR
ncbi:MAG: STAS domain-containing protein [Thiobacillus sp.]|nr:STAS domain-containing protein [Thiobacillus sp.]